VPASGVVVRVARYGDPSSEHTIDWANWDCAPNS
jgi:hypothetical protein